MNETLLTIDGLKVSLPGRARGDAARTVIHDVTLSIGEAQSVGLVGESGSGKSMTAKAIMGLLPRGARSAGTVSFKGDQLADFGRRRWASFRGRDVSIIHQDPRAHTNPLVRIGDFLVESVVATKQCSRDEAIGRARQLLSDVGIPDAARRLRQYPHELSGGLLQRMMIVMALMPQPALILADEPTTALDVTVQAEVVEILAEQVRARRVGLLFITHDLDLAAAITDELAVMYAGVVVERGPAELVTTAPRHPYTAGLLRARPKLDAVQRLSVIPGRSQSAFEVGAGCVFASRCSVAVDRCISERPVLRSLDGRSVACHRAEELSASSEALATA